MGRRRERGKRDDVPESSSASVHEDDGIHSLLVKSDDSIDKGLCGSLDDDVGSGGGRRRGGRRREEGVQSIGGDFDVVEISGESEVDGPTDEM